MKFDDESEWAMRKCRQSMSTSIVYACASPRIPSRLAKARARFAPPMDARQGRDIRDDSASRILFRVSSAQVSTATLGVQSG